MTFLLCLNFDPLQSLHHCFVGPLKVGNLLILIIDGCDDDGDDEDEDDEDVEDEEDDEDEDDDEEEDDD